jgi:tellurite resistance protein TerC
MDKPLWMWSVFLTLVLLLLAFDLGVLHRKEKKIKLKESLYLSGFYIFFALAFGGWIWFELGAKSGSEYFTGYLIEKTLAMDNIFVISLIFSYFGIPEQYRYRVLFWGILGVIILRAIMIGLGAVIINEFSWVLYIFAAFLIITGIKMLCVGDKLPNIENNPLLKFLRKKMRVTNELHGNKFTVKLLDKNTGKKAIYMTPLLVALILIEFVDLIFAVDSIPAIFTITLDPYIVYTSNIFAILGLRALYFALAAIIHRFKYLKQALAWVLIFIGSKTFIADLMGLEKFPASISLSVTFGIIMAGIAVSIYKTREK